MKLDTNLNDELAAEPARKFETLFEKGSTERRIAEDMVRCLHTLGALALEAEIMRNVPGKHSTKVAVFRSLIDAQIVHRIGEGRRKAPFQYCLDLKVVPDSLKLSDAGPARKRSKRKSSKSPELKKEEAPEISWKELPEEELEEITVFFRLLHDQALKLRRCKTS